MHMTPPPFARFEWMIAWRYLRAKRVEGGVSVMTWISLIGIILAVFALIATLAVRAGFRAEFVDTILGANAHVSIYTSRYVDSQGQITRGFSNAVQVADNLRAVAGVLRAAPVIKDQAMVTANGRNLGAQVFGMSQENLASLPR
ncbi:MAG TPA: lipoprotein-releasing system transmembrane subunit LolC, partial [Rhodobacter sp.]|nr:lipoprotein-releasing system transmembrane subunit LolC [Rhodobacter sp.]